MAKKILIIDDEADVMKMVVYRLEAKGYEVIGSATGKEGMEAARTNRPDLIILDYRLPDTSPCEVSKTIKCDPALKDIPIILVTASVEKIDEKARECMAVDYIAKPIGPEELYEKTAKYI